MYDEDGLVRLLHDLILSAVTVPPKRYTTHRAYTRRIGDRYHTLVRFSRHPVIEVFSTLYEIDEDATRLAIRTNATAHASILCTKK